MARLDKTARLRVKMGSGGGGGKGKIYRGSQLRARLSGPLTRARGTSNFRRIRTKTITSFIRHEPMSKVLSRFCNAR